jgi:predicted aspartyl protease
MFQLRLSATLISLSGILAATTLGCSSIGSSPHVEQVNAAPPQVAAAVPASPIATPVQKAPAQPDPYQQAINRASSAFNMSRSAQSQDDWRLVESRWQQAIDSMGSIPATSPHRAQMQSKLSEYRRNLEFAQQQANRPTASADDGTVVISLPQSAQPSYNALPPAVPTSSRGGVFQAPIIRRAGGTPVINVVFNGNQQFQMIVDTGASGTLITSQMAAALNVIPVGQARVATASARSVIFPLGYVNSIEVGGAIANRVLVAVGGSDLDIGLLGHDFFGNYDVTVRQNVVEFRER